ncbi:hypothetical protein Skr01_73420 [Sphaerisporangium krabiense]|uniref:Putative surface protein with fasciclin (FAS1) repeats n=1 Tax=Sphaerisporangium krabiense TaxID=763782 RepID=A0A7W8Z8W9_9ACTN|nr:fasciclin domain-containing protein [Sphaerisporangium krabiense]MBB5629598.1 putative surface protein with fasciclin (FAS1) repeats [Sphaerisporangium krabiense]GII67257.1 hypothetical protein Skr01_73420 [Sphaerisporangium krabiense]
MGPGCGALPKSGPGSPAQLAGEPLVTAASHIPQLSSLVAAVKKAGLEDAANSATDITVFAPTDDAFAKIPKDKLNRLEQDKQQLARVLAHHIVEGRKTPADLKRGNLVTLDSGRLNTGESNGTYTVDGAKVVCGNIQTRNATIYMIDSVLKSGG